jgi:hypothetical protein
MLNEKLRSSQILDMELESVAAADAARQQQQRADHLNSVTSRTSTGSGSHHHHHHHHHHPHSSVGRPSGDSLRLRGGKITIGGSDGDTLAKQVYDFKESDMLDLGQIGNGEFGTVHKVLHKPSQVHMALKRIGPTVGNQGERKKVLKELDFVMECNDYAHVVKFYGVKFNNEPVTKRTSLK